MAEEGERARQSEAYALPDGDRSGEIASDLGVFELLAANTNLPTPKPSRDPRHPIDDATWEGYFDADGRPKVPFEEFRKEVFRRVRWVNCRRRQSADTLC